MENLGGAGLKSAPILGDVKMHTRLSRFRGRGSPAGEPERAAHRSAQEIEHHHNILQTIMGGPHFGQPKARIGKQSPSPQNSSDFELY